MNDMENCKGCKETVRMTPEEIKRKYVDTLKLGKNRVVADDVYNRRIAVCMDCPSLEYGTTCKHCGCLVLVRAKLIESKCPYPYNPKWPVE